MNLNIRVIPKSSRNLIKEDNGSVRAYLTQPAQDNLANKQLIELLARYFKVKKYQIKIIRGEKSRNKVVEVDAAGTWGKK